MAYSNTNEAGAPPPMVHFAGDNFTAYRAFRWDTSAGTGAGKPIVPASDGIFSGVATADGKAGFLAVPGAIVRIETSGSVSAGTLYSVATDGRLTTGAGVALKALESAGGAGVIIKAEVWKPKG